MESVAAACRERGAQHLEQVKNTRVKQTCRGTGTIFCATSQITSSEWDLKWVGGCAAASQPGRRCHKTQGPSPGCNTQRACTNCPAHPARALFFRLHFGFLVSVRADLCFWSRLQNSPREIKTHLHQFRVSIDKILARLVGVLIGCLFFFIRLRWGLISNTYRQREAI